MNNKDAQKINDEILVNDVFVNQPEHFDYVRRQLNAKLQLQYASKTALGITEAWRNAKKGDLREIYVMLDYFDKEEIDMMCKDLPIYVSVELRKGWNDLRESYEDGSPDKEFKCRDCETTENLDTPHLKDEIWFKFAKEDELLCVACTEKHLGRKIIWQDCNNEWWGKDWLRQRNKQK
jgi:hypothetical protein